MKTATRANPGLAASIRRYYTTLKVPFCSTARARRDVIALLDERKAIARTGEALMMAALPYTGDPAVRGAVDSFRAVIEGRPES